MDMKRVLFLLMLAPALLAPVRLKDSTPGFFTPPAQSPAPESYSLPPADPLVTPTAIEVSPTLTPPPSPTDVVSGSLSLPLPPSPTAVTPTVVYVPMVQGPAKMSDVEATLCVHAMDLVQEMSMLSYQQKRSPDIMTLFIAATAASEEAQTMQWPTMTAFRSAANNIPFFQPQKSELKDATQAAMRLCGGINVPQKSVTLPRPE